ncbi:HD domain-containing protein [Pasteurellaceae bacterium USgator11]|nr:HD domain-containing protein [Pasteurellaceae bacterium USgator41]TNG96473.1 HD domain-containing protein [Pasteurellaceae bacterium UScroc12]TNH00445.1 HD domain-containing protein [Pasteurellaceae bacterium UScroc31]TNH01724.1 HD domain-containing protein [Pasteurellaceae bacterium USgator11]
MLISERAKNLAIRLHYGRVDKAGKRYAEHLAFVAAHPLIDSDELEAVAWLHDSLEDTDLSYRDLVMYFGEELARAVKAITKQDGEPYQDYLVRVKANPLARIVKMADLSHNMNLDRLPEITEKDRQRLIKYRRALEFLSR